MSGEYTIAKQVVDDAVVQAEQANSMDADTMALAILGHVLTLLSKTRSRKDLESYIDYELDNLGDEDQVVTRGC